MIIFNRQSSPTGFDTEPAKPEPKIEIRLTDYTLEFIDKFSSNKAFFDKSTDPTVKVSDVLASIAHIYERIRNIIEYKSEHVLRRNAIERMLKRLLGERPSHDTSRLAYVLIRELIWAKYFPNDTIPRSKVKQVAVIINKYLFLLGLLLDQGTVISGNQLRDWVWGLASCEIEETLDPSVREAYVMLMFAWVKHYFIWQSDKLSQQEKDTQVYLAIHRALAKSDEPIMRYHLLVQKYPAWSQSQKQTVSELAQNFTTIHQAIEKYLNYPDRFKLYRLLKKHIAPFEVFKTLVMQKGNQIKPVLENQEQFTQSVSNICQNKYAQIQKKVTRGIVRSIIYIFLTKVLFALLIEVPYELYRIGQLTILPLTINIIVPPGMMLLIGLTIKIPGEANTYRIINKLKTIVYTNN